MRKTTKTALSLLNNYLSSNHIVAGTLQKGKTWEEERTVKLNNFFLEYHLMILKTQVARSWHTHTQ